MEFKGTKGSISAMIRDLKKYKLFIHPASENLIREMDKYKYEVKKP